MKPLDLHDVIAATLHVVKPHFKCQGITLTVELTQDVPWVWGIAPQLEQVFLNLLVNAWQAMPAGGNVTMRTDVDDDQHVRITLRDNGEGMSPEDIEQAFKPFVSPKHEKRRGLGLAICRQIMEQHGGTMTLESTPGAGSTVTLTFVRADTAGPPPHGEEEPLDT